MAPATPIFFRFIVVRFLFVRLFLFEFPARSSTVCAVAQPVSAGGRCGWPYQRKNCSPSSAMPTEQVVPVVVALDVEQFFR